MLAEISIFVCVGSVALVWAAGALYSAFLSPHGKSPDPRERPQGQPPMKAGNIGLIGVAAVCAGLAIANRSHFDDLAVRALWVRVLGLAVLAASTVFILWARLSIGIMWSAMPRLHGDHQLRTHGPYAVTRHPIYTGGLGMLLGITLLYGLGQWVVLFPACLIVLEVKVRLEEHLMMAAFPDEYPPYRRQVPQLVPGLHALRRLTRNSPAVPGAHASRRAVGTTDD